MVAIKRKHKFNRKELREGIAAQYKVWEATGASPGSLIGILSLWAEGIVELELEHAEKNKERERT